MSERFFGKYGCFIVSRYIKGGKKITQFLDTHVCIINPHWQSSEIMFFCKLDVVISDILVDSFYDVLYVVLSVILPELHEKPRRKDWITEKSAKRNLCEGHHFLAARPTFFYVILCCFLRLLSPLAKWCTCWMAPIKKYKAMVGVLSHDIMSERSKIWQSLAI